MQPLDGLPLPGSGSLFFFSDTVYIPAGYDPGDNDGFKVIYSHSPLSASAIRTPPQGLDTECIFKGFSLEPKLDLTAASKDIWEIECLRLSESESDSYSQLFAKDGSTHHIGGYPDVVQNNDLEVKAELVSHGIYCGDSKGFREGQSRGLGSGSADWRLLLQIDSEEDAGMMWGDVGKLFFMIRRRS